MADSVKDVHICSKNTVFSIKIAKSIQNRLITNAFRINILNFLWISIFCCRQTYIWKCHFHSGWFITMLSMGTYCMVDVMEEAHLKWHMNDVGLNAG